MTNFDFVLLYVEDPVASAAFYQDLLGRPPVDSAPGFAMLPLKGDVMLGLWRRPDVKPQASALPGCSEISFAVADADAVRATHTAWQERGVRIAQHPTEMGFGHTFVGLDPDGHRLRVYSPAR